MSGSSKVLIADSGSSKTEWKIIEGDIAGGSFYSAGINPYFLGTEAILNIFKNEIGTLKGNIFTRVYFYGTGCNSRMKEDIVRDALTRFVSSEDTFIGSDLLAAARSLCQETPGIACIMGTGSNSCYYDGNSIKANIPPLGYILGDEGGGAVLGRKLISSILKGQVPAEVKSSFLEKYRMTTAEILDNVYTRPFPNRFLGQFARFLSENISVPELKEIVVSSFGDFIRRNILQYPESASMPVHFTGSIAFHFRELLIEQLELNNLTAGEITLSPMDRLIFYHIKHFRHEKW